MNYAALQQAVNRLLKNMFAWIAFIPAFVSTTAQDVSITLENEDGTETTVTHPNITKISDTLSGRIHEEADKTFYIASDGNDSNDGSIGAPLKTIREAAARVSNNGRLTCILKDDITMDYHVELYGRKLILKSNDGSIKKITQTHYDSGSYYYLYAFSQMAGGNATIGARNIAFVSDEYTGSNTRHTRSGHIVGPYDGKSGDMIASLYLCSIDLHDADFMVSPKAGGAGGGKRHLSLYGCEIIENSNLSLVLTDSIGVLEFKKSSGSGEPTVGGIVRDSDSGNPINFISNINFSS